MHRIATMQHSEGRLRRHLPPALLAILVFSAVFFGFTNQKPLEVYNGSISPTVVSAGETVTFRWTQEWNQLCPVTVTREVIGPDGWVHRTIPSEVSPPEKTGARYLERDSTMPSMPSGSVHYRALIEPHCWIDKVWQRRYWSPSIAFNVR